VRTARTGLLLAGVLLLEAGARALWGWLPASAWTGSRLEIAALLWTGCVRLVDLGIVLLACRAGWVPALRWRPAGLRAALLPGAGVALGFGAIAFLGEMICRARGGSLFQGILLGGAADPVYADPGVVAAHALVAVLFAPLVEEAVFRGVLLAWLRERLPAVLAILLSALFFAACHALPSWLRGESLPVPVLQFLGGLAFAWLALGKGGLLGAWILHAAGNGFLLALQVWYG
jgi:membrane protease YdiL (CAAX protease family)